MSKPSNPTKPKLAAFIDESYDGANREAPVYVLAAVVVTGPVQVARRSLLEATTATEYHTTELYRSGQHEAITAMLGSVLALHETSVVVAHVPYQRATEAARQSCLETLAIELNALGVLHMTADDRQLPFAGDRRDRMRPNTNDLATIRKLREAGRVHRDMELQHRADKWEQLLWLPDAVAWCARRHLSEGSSEHWQTVEGACHVVTLNSAGAVASRHRPTLQ
jgi:hypothetical protein